MQSMYKALSIAHFFITKGIVEFNLVNPMKLQKLIYFAHGWYLAIHSQPLIKDEIQAWRYGPVIPDIYHNFKHYGNNGISRFDYPLVEPLDQRTINLLEAVWNTFKNYDAVTLSNLTHINQSPWDLTISNNNGIVDNNLPISNQVIKDYFVRTYQAQNG